MEENVEYVDRRNTNCYKWDSITEEQGNSKLLPMSIADMDFKTPECVRNALKEYVEMGALGYNLPSEKYFASFCNWEKKHFQNEIEKEWIRYAPGVVVAISWLLELLTKPMDVAIILTPVYDPFVDMIRNNGLQLICSPLINKDGKYSIDFEDFEDKVTKNHVKIFLLCSPHNPVGRVWKEDELKRLVDICKRNQVFIISDEIHHDILLFQNKHISLLNIGDYREHMVMLTSTAKSFNLAGVENSFMVIPSEKVRKKVDVLQDRIATHSGNGLGYVAVTAAYEQGEKWLKKVCTLIENNYLYIKRVLLKELPELKISPLEGTFLMWIDFGYYLKENEKIETVMKNDCGLIVNSGRKYGGETYTNFARFNIATSKENIEYAVRRIIGRFGKQEEENCENY